MRSTATLAAVLLIAVAFSSACGTKKQDVGFTPEVDADVPPPPPQLTDPDASSTIGDGGVFNDGAIEAEPSCTPDAGGPGPVQRICIHAGGDTNECDGLHDLLGFAPNGTGGNGFDDNCNGLVDEGCACTSAGITKECYLVPASQTVAGVPPGWCALNSKGTVDCVKPSTEFAGHWSGQCRGAQPPFADDICAKGDYDCDGREQNSKTHDCTCGPGSVACPTTPLQTVPYPPPSQLPLKVDASTWFLNPGEAAQATNWKWTLVGGDCDNVLPHPTFAMFKTPDGTATPLGAQQNALGQSQKEHGIVAAAPQISSSFYPGFSLSGDYLVTGEFDLFGKHYACTQKIEVRAPGIRAEACWDTESQAVDLDIHMARVDGFSACPKKGWSATCPNQDCYYSNCYNGGSPAWGYTASPASACQGWGSQASGTCGNPRLDRDTNGLSGVCDPNVTNPNTTGGGVGGGFCGPENINVDAPANGSKYAVGVKYYGGGNIPSRTHVNVYCNGERILSTGYNPVTGIDFPKLTTSGGNDSGDLWKVGLVTATITPQGLKCDMKPTAAGVPRPATDGSNAYCVDTSGTDGPDSVRYFASGGASPLNSDALCFH